jgi:hypothetical protein
LLLDPFWRLSTAQVLALKATVLLLALLIKVKVGIAVVIGGAALYRNQKRASRAGQRQGPCGAMGDGPAIGWPLAQEQHGGAGVPRPLRGGGMASRRCCNWDLPCDAADSADQMRLA